MKKLVYCMGMYKIFKSLECLMKDEEIENLINSLESDSIIVDYNHEVIIFTSEKDLNMINEKLGYKFDCETLSEFTQWFYEGTSYGIKDYGCFHFSYDEVHDSLKDYLNNEDCTEKLFGLIKKKSINEILDDLCEKEVLLMMKRRLNQINDIIKNSEIAVW
ncbi:MAG: hypothetical protein ACRDD7_16975 [Peptostreptococcaceae bacterium]